MPKTPRNAPCPCGSGKKFKRCCLKLERDLETQFERIAAITALPSSYPRLRPSSQAFDRWVEAWDGEEATDDFLDAGIALVDSSERRRIVSEFAAEAEISVDVIEEGLEGALLLGGVLAALDECRELHPDDLALLERRPAGDAEGLALVLHSEDLWSIREAEAVEETIRQIPDEVDDEEYELRWNAASDGFLARHWTEAHERRLGVLVARFRARLPVGEFPLASAALVAACERFDSDGAFRGRCGALLLCDAVCELGASDWSLAA